MHLIKGCIIMCIKRSIKQRGVKRLEEKVKKVYELQIIDYEPSFHDLILKRCYEKIRNIIWVQNHNSMIVMLTEHLELPKELIMLIRSYCKETQMPKPKTAVLKLK